MLKHFPSEKRFTEDEQIQTALEDFFTMKLKRFYADGI